MDSDVFMNCKWQRAEKRTITCVRRGCLRNKMPITFDGNMDKIWRNCDGWPLPHELGHWLTLLLAAVGIHKSGYVWLKRRLGLGPKCGCGQRAERLNTWGHWFFRPRRG